jgi:beta-glucosidase
VTDVAATDRGVSATVTNVGDRAGGHVVQAYACPPERALLGFARVELAPGGSARVELPLTLPPGDRPARVEVGSYAGDPAASAVALPT